MYSKLFQLYVFFILSWFSITYAEAFTPTVYQCPGVEAFIVYYLKDGQVVSIVGAGGYRYLACQGATCRSNIALVAEQILRIEAEARDNVRQVNLNEVCR